MIYVLDKATKDERKYKDIFQMPVVADAKIE